MNPPRILPTATDTPLQQVIAAALQAAGNWIGFDEFMALALYSPGLGYYASDLRKFGLMPGSGQDGGGSDFATAPEMSAHFGRTLARQLAEALRTTGTTQIWEFGAGSGALAEQLLKEAGSQIDRYTIVDLSGSLRERQRLRLAAYADKIEWASTLPARINGVVLGNELLDAMPVKLLARLQGVWHERGVCMAPTLPTACGSLPPEGALRLWPGEAGSTAPAGEEEAPTLPTACGSLPPEGAAAPAARQSRFRGPGLDGKLPQSPASGDSLRAQGLKAYSLVFADRPTALRPPVEIEGEHDYVTEVHLQAEGFVRTLADRLERGAVFLIDYGFPEREYYHPQRSMGTVMCHRAHRVDTDSLSDVGGKDITAHVNFTGIALAGQEAGLDVLGYTSQGRFLLNCGLLDSLESASLAERAMALRLVNEHEMGELFKVIAFGAGTPLTAAWAPMGFASGDRIHML